MAQTTLRLLNGEVFFRIFLSVLLLMIQKGQLHAYVFKVGDSTGWTLPSNAVNYNQWAEKNRFQIGDTLLFVYASGQDSVLHVTKDDYTNCSSGTPLEKFTGGNTSFKFNQSGPHYFISGDADNCRKNEKLVVVVMADRSKNNPNGTVVTPSPSPSPSHPPSDRVPPPSPAPAGEESPPPPSGVEMNPTPAPSQESTPPRNGASSIVASVGGIIVAGFLGSSLVLGI